MAARYWWQRCEACSALALAKSFVLQQQLDLVSDTAISSKNDLPLCFTAIYRISKLALNFMAPSSLRMCKLRGRGKIAIGSGLGHAFLVISTHPRASYGSRSAALWIADSTGVQSEFFLARAKSTQSSYETWKRMCSIYMKRKIDRGTLLARRRAEELKLLQSCP